MTPGRQPDSKTDGPRPELKPVQPDKAVEGQDGVRVALTSIESVTGKAVQPGEVGGPAIRVRVTMTNAGVRSLNAASSVVNCYYGANRKPAGALVEPGGVPLYGQLAPGKTTYGVYIFAVPVKQRGDVTITVDYRVEVPVVVFQGDVG